MIRWKGVPGIAGTGVKPYYEADAASGSSPSRAAWGGFPLNLNVPPRPHHATAAQHSASLNSVGIQQVQPLS